MLRKAEDVSPSVETSERVRDFYDRRPYPPPMESLAGYRRHWQDYQRRRVDFHLFWPDLDYREDLTILIAGCGTSQAAKYALRWPAAQVIGIDCSATSVQYTERLKRRHNLNNLDVYQLPIEQVDDLGVSFDQVVCTGVLHHLAEPVSGLSALRGVLKSGGAMHVMVYAPYGRTGVYMLQEFCRRLAIEDTETGVRDLIVALETLPAGHPLQQLLMESPELRDEATIADALLHPNDRSYSVPRLFDLIRDAGLTFGRWLRQAPYSVHCGVIAKIPQARDILCLPPEEQYAVIELYRGTMVRHSAILYHMGSDPSRPVDFVGHNWREYVPIRVSDTVCIQERLSTGASAVLINRSHTSRDLFLPVGPTEERLFHAVDGHNSLADIAEITLESFDREAHIEMTGKFFEQLWWHDLVVFDTRHARTA